MSDWYKATLKEALGRGEKLEVYNIGETVQTLARKLNREPCEILKLNANENFFIPLGFLKDLMKEVLEEVDPRIYPANETRELKESLATRANAAPEQILIGTGSDQLIDLVSRTLLQSGDEALSIKPTFSMYERCVKIQGAIYRSIPLLEDFSLDIESILHSVTKKTKILFICSPNNPTANQFDLEDILRLADDFGGFLAMDEAYVDFADYSIVDLVEKYDKLIVFRTFSKAFGLAGLRLGYAVASPGLSKIISERFQMPFSVSHVALRLALKLLDSEVSETAVRELKIERDKLVDQLNEINGIQAFNSKTNFVLFDANRNSGEIGNELLKRAVIVKNIGQVLGFKNCLRVTVAPPPMSGRFLVALRQVIGQEVA